MASDLVVRCLQYPREVWTSIENIFHMVHRQLKEDALEKQESYKQFVKLVRETITSTSKDYISKTIASIPVRLKAVIQQNIDNACNWDIRSFVTSYAHAARPINIRTLEFL